LAQVLAGLESWHATIAARPGTSMQIAGNVRKTGTNAHKITKQLRANKDKPV
jgi:hypothetical protein